MFLFPKIFLTVYTIMVHIKGIKKRKNIELEGNCMNFGTGLQYALFILSLTYLITI